MEKMEQETKILECVWQQLWIEFCRLDDIYKKIIEEVKPRKELPETLNLVRYDGLIAFLSTTKTKKKTYTYARLVAVKTGVEAKTEIKYEVKSLRTGKVSSRIERREYIQLLNAKDEFYGMFKELAHQYSIVRALALFFTKKDDYLYILNSFDLFYEKHKEEFKERKIDKKSFFKRMTEIVY